MRRFIRVATGATLLTAVYAASQTPRPALKIAANYIKWIANANGWDPCPSNRAKSCMLGFAVKDVTQGKTLGVPGYGAGHIGPTVTSLKYSTPCGEQLSIYAVVVDGAGVQWPGPTSYATFNCK